MTVWAVQVHLDTARQPHTVVAKPITQARNMQHVYACMFQFIESLCWRENNVTASIHYATRYTIQYIHVD